MQLDSPGMDTPGIDDGIDDAIDDVMDARTRILLMGDTGCGKSTFISHCMNQDSDRVTDRGLGGVPVSEAGFGGKNTGREKEFGEMPEWPRHDMSGHAAVDIGEDRSFHYFVGYPGFRAPEIVSLCDHIDEECSYDSFQNAFSSWSMDILSPCERIQWHQQLLLGTSTGGMNETGLARAAMLANNELSEAMASTTRSSLWGALESLIEAMLSYSSILDSVSGLFTVSIPPGLMYIKPKDTMDLTKLQDIGQSDFDFPISSTSPSGRMTYMRDWVRRRLYRTHSIKDLVGRYKALEIL